VNNSRGGAPATFGLEGIRRTAVLFMCLIFSFASKAILLAPRKNIAAFTGLSVWERLARIIPILILIS
jgi:hypothetical protein